MYCPSCGASTQITDIIDPQPAVGKRTGRVLKSRSGLNHAVIKQRAAPTTTTGAQGECALCHENKTRLIRITENQKLLRYPVPTGLNADRMVAEVLHISRPILHLLMLYRYGFKSWKPWFAALLVEVSTIIIYFQVITQWQIARRWPIFLDCPTSSCTNRLGYANTTGVHVVT